MSLEGAVELDTINRDMQQTQEDSVSSSFNPTLYRQPSLVEKELRPEKYRNTASSRSTKEEASRASDNLAEMTGESDIEGIQIFKHCG